MENFNFTVTEDFNGQRLDRCIVLNLAEQNKAQFISRIAIQKLIANGCVIVNEIQILEKDHRLQTGDLISVRIDGGLPNYKDTRPKIIASEVVFEILYEDDDLLVINKPPGLVVHPGVGNRENTLVNGLIFKYGNAGDLQGDNIFSTEQKHENHDCSDNWFRPGIVHRLDKDTSGLMLVAKNNESHFALAKQLADRSIQRKYLALVYGLVEPPIGTIETYIIKNPKNPTKMLAVSGEDRGGKIAITHYRVKDKIVLNSDSQNKKHIGISLLECSLETGRTHQIRVHMKYQGWPIIGDEKYIEGYNFNYGAINDASLSQRLQNFPRQALHAYQIRFAHPRSGKEIFFKTDLYEDIAELIDYAKSD